MIQLTNTLSRKKEAFKAIEPDKVKLYVCGVTPYDFSHVGHGRCYVAFDLLYRLLKFLGHEVTYVRNFTDIDDKIIKRAEKELGDKNKYSEITKKYIAAYHADMDALNCLRPDVEPRVTDHIDHIIKFIEGLIDAGKAYVVDGDVYFHVSSFAEYGKLSKQKLDELRSGARVQVDERKKDPLDFALWKSEPEGEFWQSPWGYGRPGWHIECSALAKEYLGEQIDIHAGGADLIFPHHENEIAQSQGLHGVPFANYWLHNAFVTVNKEKMSKSLGNFFTLRDIFKHFDPMVIRYYLLQHHYRIPMDFSFDDIKAFEKSYRKLVRVFESVPAEVEFSKEQLMASSLVQSMLAFLYDDLNTSGMFGALFENLDLIKRDPNEAAAAMHFIQHVLGLTLKALPEEKVKITPEIQKLIDEREQARDAKDWARADELRDKLKEMGVDVQDKKL